MYIIYNCLTGLHFYWRANVKIFIQFLKILLSQKVLKIKIQNKIMYFKIYQCYKKQPCIISKMFKIKFMLTYLKIIKKTILFTIKIKMDCFIINTVDKWLFIK